MVSVNGSEVRTNLKYVILTLTSPVVYWTLTIPEGILDTSRVDSPSDGRSRLQVTSIRQGPPFSTGVLNLVVPPLSY